MKWFLLEEKPNSKRWRGIYLRTTALSPAVKRAIRRSHLKRLTDHILTVHIARVFSATEVLLEVECQSLIDTLLGRARFNIFLVPVQPEPNWVCEAEIGTGRRPARRGDALRKVTVERDEENNFVRVLVDDKLAMAGDDPLFTEDLMKVLGDRLGFNVECYTGSLDGDTGVFSRHQAQTPQEKETAHE